MRAPEDLVEEAVVLPLAQRKSMFEKLEKGRKEKTSAISGQVGDGAAAQVVEDQGAEENAEPEPEGVVNEAALAPAESEVRSTSAYGFDSRPQSVAHVEATPRIVVPVAGTVNLIFNYHTFFLLMPIIFGI
jgi:hypothetical protein